MGGLASTPRRHGTSSRVHPRHVRLFESCDSDYGSVNRRLSVLIVPDKDADGLSAGSILHRTLRHLGHPEDLIKVHNLSKGTNVHAEAEMEMMANFKTQKVIVLDQGSRPGPALLPVSADGEKRVLIIDHHMSEAVSRRPLYDAHSSGQKDLRCSPLATHNRSLRLLF